MVLQEIITVSVFFQCSAGYYYNNGESGKQILFSSNANHFGQLQILFIHWFYCQFTLRKSNSRFLLYYSWQSLPSPALGGHHHQCRFLDLHQFQLQVQALNIWPIQPTLTPTLATQATPTPTATLTTVNHLLLKSSSAHFCSLFCLYKINV